MTAASVLLPGFDGPILPEWLDRRLRAGLAGVCLFGANIVSREQVAELVAAIRAANPRAIIAIDEEGGDVTRLHYDVGSPYPGNAVLGRLDDEALTEHVARAVGWELRRFGIDLDLAPDADINSNPDNPVIGTRSFGADAGLVARHTAAWVRGLQSTGVAASVKHFPGHGDTAQDSHLALPVVSADLETLHRRELAPFVAAVEAGVRSVMSSHILLPALDAERPATLSPRVLTGLLRDELGFDGVIVSDALDMAGASAGRGIPVAAALALAAGCDLLCLGTNGTEQQLDDIEAAVVAALASGQLEPARLADAARRVAALADESAALAAARPVSPVDSGAGSPVVEGGMLRSAIEARPGIRIAQDRELIVLATTANIAVGTAPWGPAAAGATVRVVHEGEPIETRAGAQPVLIGQGNHRHDWVRAAIATVRSEHPEAVVVEMGWPSPDRAHADIVTWGASRAMGEALLAWLQEQEERS